MSHDKHYPTNMSIPTLQNTQRLSNPFSSSASSPVSLSPSPLADAQSANADKHPWSNPFQPAASPSHRAPSIDSIHLPTSPSKPFRYSYQSSTNSARPISGLPPLPASHNSDPEKSIETPSQPSYSCDDDDWPNEYYHEDPFEIKAKCLRLLLYLSGPVFITSIVLALWTLIALFLSLLLHPVNIVRKSKTLREQAINFLAPPLKIHLSFIFASIRDETYSSYSLPLLIVVNLFAPLVSVAVAISAWTAACFWFFAAIIGDPEGTEQESRRSSYLKEQDEDGKASVIGVRKWWKRWLIRGLR